MNVTAEQTLRGPLQLMHNVPRQKPKPSVYSLAEPEQSFIIVGAFWWTDIAPGKDKHQHNSNVLLSVNTPIRIFKFLKSLFHAPAGIFNYSPIATDALAWLALLRFCFNSLELSLISRRRSCRCWPVDIFHLSIDGFFLSAATILRWSKASPVCLQLTPGMEGPEKLYCLTTRRIYTVWLAHTPMTAGTTFFILSCRFILMFSV